MCLCVPVSVCICVPILVSVSLCPDKPVSKCPRVCVRLCVDLWPRVCVCHCTCLCVRCSVDPCLCKPGCLCHAFVCICRKHKLFSRSVTIHSFTRTQDSPNLLNRPPPRTKTLHTSSSQSQAKPQWPLQQITQCRPAGDEARQLFVLKEPPPLPPSSSPAATECITRLPDHPFSRRSVPCCYFLTRLMLQIVMMKPPSCVLRGGWGRVGEAEGYDENCWVVEEGGVRGGAPMRN